MTNEKFYLKKRRFVLASKRLKEQQEIQPNLYRSTFKMFREMYLIDRLELLN